MRNARIERTKHFLSKVMSEIVQPLAYLNAVNLKMIWICFWTREYRLAFDELSTPAIDVRIARMQFNDSNFTLNSITAINSDFCSQRNYIMIVRQTRRDGSVFDINRPWNRQHHLPHGLCKRKFIHEAIGDDKSKIIRFLNTRTLCWCPALKVLQLCMQNICVGPPVPQI